MKTTNADKRNHGRSKIMFLNWKTQHSKNINSHIDIQV